MASLDLARSKSENTNTAWPSEAIKQQSTYRVSQDMVLRHAEQMVKLGFLTESQSAFVTQTQLSSAGYRRGALLFDPFFQKQLGLTLTVEQRIALIWKDVDTVEKELLSEQQQLLLAELTTPRTPPSEPPRLAVPNSDDLAQVKLSGMFAKLIEVEKALRLSADQVKALRELERLTRLGLFWIDRRDASDDVEATRNSFLGHAEQIALLGILTPEQRLAFGFMC